MRGAKNTTSASRDPDRSVHWTARLALVTAAAAVLNLLVAAGLRGIAVLALGMAGLAVTAAAVWWALAHRGLLRALAVVLASAVPVALLVHYALIGLLWPVTLSVVLWAGAAVAARATLGMDARPIRAVEHSTLPPKRPFLIMNPLSGGGKVGRFDLVDKARRLGADVVVLDPAHHQDVSVLAREAVADGADLLGVAGGDGTQALVAGVAAQHNVPFMVVSAGTRNHFALDLGLDRDDPSTCLDALTDGVEIRVDLGVIGDRVFVNNASFGTYAAVVQSPAYRDDKVPTILRTLPDLLTHHAGPRLTVHAANVTIDAPQAVLVSNNPYRMGDSAGLGRRPRLDSGVLGVLCVTVDNATQAAGMLRGAGASGLTAMTSHEAVIEADTAEIPVGVDGEALTLPTPVRCRIRPGALRVRVPRHRQAAFLAKPHLSWHRVGQLAFATRHARAA
ncbi:diacylglycerol kinase family protein [Streptomyces sp. GESEQ-35]|uniref:diacylglycerol/lipid kinase family protein n=1 Tax=Streptomyces sp. GESEQ-35 TaxID=2812657 RepID=UPI001B335EFC|nr:diacylglycerol kinase family protein [Streptomyces sp. GESEQ-35]